jgi:hypothetical protein
MFLTIDGIVSAAPNRQYWLEGVSSFMHSELPRDKGQFVG